MFTISEMPKRSYKRKRYSDVKDWLVVQLHELITNSFDFNNDIDSADEDLMLMFKTMQDKQSELYARSIGLEEKYRYEYCFKICNY